MNRASLDLELLDSVLRDTSFEELLAKDENTHVRNLPLLATDM